MAGKSESVGIVIGNNYPNSNKELKFAVADAEKIKEIFDNKNLCVFDDVILLLDKTSKEASTAIEKTLRRADINKVFIYYSGHGKKDFESNLCLLFKDTEEDSLLTTSLPFDFIIKCTKYPPRKSVIIVLDCCYSGAAGTRDADTDVMEALRKNKCSGTIILTSTGLTGSPTAREDANLGHGIFTYYLIEGLEKGLADQNNDGLISIDELYDYVYKKTIENCNQSPKREGRIEGSFLIGRNPIKIKENEYESKKKKLLEEFSSRLPTRILSESQTILRKHYKNSSSMEHVDFIILGYLDSLLNSNLSLEELNDDIESYVEAVQHLKGLTINKVPIPPIGSVVNISKLDIPNIEKQGDYVPQGRTSSPIASISSTTGTEFIPDESKIIDPSIERYNQALKVFTPQDFPMDWVRNQKDLGNEFRDLSDPKKAIEYFESALGIAKEIGDRHGEGIWLGNLGLAYSEMSESRKAIEYYEQALKISREIGDRRGEGADLGYLGTIYLDLGEPIDAIEYYEQASKIFKELEDRSSENCILVALGVAYYNLKEYRKAIEYYESALKIAKELENRSLEGTQLGLMGNAYRDMGEPRKAIEYYEQASKIFKELRDRSSEGTQLEILGNAYYILKEYRKAIEYFEPALEIAKELGNRSSEGTLLSALGSTYIYLGKSKKAIEYFEPALKIAKELEDRSQEVIRLNWLGTAYCILKEHRKAIEYYEPALKINKELKDRSSERVTLSNLGLAYSEMGESRKAIEYYEQSLRIAKELGNSKGISDCESELRALKSPKKESFSNKLFGLLK